jgi:phospholipid/cholesterol/gamma-HCH transport system substrate-binding protein
MTTEAKVGFFIVFGLVMLFLLTTQVNNFRNVKSNGYTLEVYIDDSTGLSKNTKVKMNGINVGWIKNLKIAEDFVVLEIFIKDGYKVPRDSEVLLVQENLLGSRIVLIRRGDSREYLSEGDFIKKYKVYASFEETSDSIYQTSEQFGKLARELRETMNMERRADVQNAIIDLSEILLEVKEILKENRGDFRATMYNVRSATDRLPYVVSTLEKTLKRYDTVGVTINREVEDVAMYAKSLIQELNNTVGDNGDSLGDTLESVDSFFTAGEESLEKLDKILASMTESELQFAMRVESHGRDDMVKTYVDINYLPNPNTYYLFSMVSSPNFEEKREDGTFENTLHTEDETYFSIQYGKRYGDWLFRAGLIESRGGIGVDYFSMEDDLKVSLEVSDFSAINDIRNEYGNVKSTVRYRIYDHIDFFAGGDNLINEDRRLFFGVGFYFIDNDLKTLVGMAGSAL